MITGLAGLRPRDDDTLEVRPLAPGRWSHFAVDAIPYNKVKGVPITKTELVAELKKHL